MEQKPPELATHEPSPTGRGLVTRALLARLRLALALGGALALASFWREAVDWVGSKTFGPAAPPAGPAVEYFCPMHPSVVSSGPARCPTCSMPLSRRVAAASVAADTRPRVELSAARVAQAGIRTEQVTWRELAFDIEAGGVLRYDETRIRRIAMGLAGIVTSVEQSVDGARVARAAPLLRIASSPLSAALAAFETSSRQLRDAEGRAASAAVERLRAQTESLRRQLREGGLAIEQIDADSAVPASGTDVPIVAPFDCVVLHLEVTTGESVSPGAPLIHIADAEAVVAILDVRRRDASVLRVGLSARVFDPARPQTAIDATVSAIAPFVDESSQSIQVRLALAKGAVGGPIPGTMIAASIRVPVGSVEPWRSLPRVEQGPARQVYECPMHKLVRDAPGICESCGGMKLIPRTIAGGPAEGAVLAVPSGAVVATGTRTLVFVQVDPGTFEAREVVLGPRAGTWFPVISGIDAGATVAASGAFLLDAETRLDPATAGSYFGASDGAADERAR